MSGRKIAAATVQNRTQTPFWRWVRNKLLAVDRLPITPPPGLPTADGKAEYHNPLRFPKTNPLVLVQQSNQHCLVEFIILCQRITITLGMDGRREVKPPKPLYLSDGHHAQFGTHTGEVLA
ncbi:hypothetical protein OSTOST_16769 [Ostertagia ostertagi]